MKLSGLVMLSLALPAAILQGTGGVVGPFTMTVRVPLWFVLFGWIAPTGDILFILRQKMGMPQKTQSG